MLDVVLLLLPIFSIIGLGRASVVLGFAEQRQLKGLNDFALYFALPALLFRSIVTADALHIADIASVYLAACLFVYVLAALVARFALELRPTDAAAFGLNATYGNVIYLGTPIITASYGQPGVALLVSIIALHSGILLPLGAALIELGNRADGDVAGAVRRSLYNLLRNPIVMAIAAAFLWRSAGLTLIPPLKTFLSLLAGAASPLALFCVGASLPALRGKQFNLDASLPAFLKLFGLPAVVALFAVLLGLSGPALTIALLTAAMPTGANAFLVTQRAEGFVAASAATVAMTTTVSLTTISALLVLFHSG